MYEDFFMQLIALAEKTDSSDPALRNLAEKATNLSHIPEIDISALVSVYRKDQWKYQIPLMCVIILCLNTPEKTFHE